MPALSILILSEDSSPSAHHTLTKLASRMLRLVEGHSQTQRIQFEPAEQTTKLGVRANLWKSWRAPNPRDQRAIRMLRRKLATKILERGVPGYVLFHFDGDRSWAKRATSENVKKFEAFVQGLRPLIEEHLQDQDQDRVDERLRRICPIVPFYSIESWLYQNTKLASQLCQKGCGKHLDLIERWERDRTMLDEVLKPKGTLCIGSRHNRDLAESFTSEVAEALYDLGKSFHHTVQRLQTCPGLQAALRRTFSPTPNPR